VVAELEIQHRVEKAIHSDEEVLRPSIQPCEVWRPLPPLVEEREQVVRGCNMIMGTGCTLTRELVPQLVGKGSCLGRASTRQRRRAEGHGPPTTTIVAQVRLQHRGLREIGFEANPARRGAGGFREERARGPLKLHEERTDVPLLEARLAWTAAVSGMSHPAARGMQPPQQTAHGVDSWPPRMSFSLGHQTPSAA